MLDAIDLYKDLIHVPLPLSVLAQVGGTLRSDLAGEDWTETVDPRSDAFMADVDPAFVQQVFDIPQ